MPTAALNQLELWRFFGQKLCLCFTNNERRLFENTFATVAAVKLPPILQNPLATEPQDARVVFVTENGTLELAVHHGCVNSDGSMHLNLGLGTTMDVHPIVNALTPQTPLPEFIEQL
jgi:hypothetical protein